MSAFISGNAARRRLRERVAAREEAARIRGAATRAKLGKPPDVDSAADYIEHYNRYGWRHFTRDHCPRHLVAAVAAHRRSIAQ